jgi:hypothetical protein
METTTIIFEFSSKYGVFRDALHLPVDHSLTDEQILAMQQERFDNWLALVEAPAVEEAPGEEAASDA